MAQSVEESCMRFGLLLANQHPPSTSVAARFAETIAQVRLARDVGFDMVALGQHFLSTEFQMLQPAIVAARLAAETGPMRLGITIYLLPLLNPIAVAEEAASLDVITGGRFILGAGQGDRVPRLRQHLEVVKRLWAGDTVTFDSPYCRLVDARLELRPIQQPHPPVWMAANNDRAVERAAELGDAWVIN